MIIIDRLNQLIINRWFDDGEKSVTEILAHFSGEQTSTKKFEKNIEKAKEIYAILESLCKPLTSQDEEWVKIRTLMAKIENVLKAEKENRYSRQILAAQERVSKLMMTISELPEIDTSEVAAKLNERIKLIDEMFPELKSEG